MLAGPIKLETHVGYSNNSEALHWPEALDLTRPRRVTETAQKLLEDGGSEEWEGGDEEVEGVNRRRSWEQDGGRMKTSEAVWRLGGGVAC